MTYDYSFGGLHIRSDIVLPGLLAATPSADAAPQLRLTAETGAPLEPDRLRYEWHQGYRLRLGEHGGRWLIRSRFDGSFLIDRDGRALHLIAESLPPASEVIEVLLRRVLTRVPMLHGAISVHAASLARDGGGLLLAGRSGAGKSTLCGWLACHGGWQILGDDTALIWNPQAPLIGAGAKTVCLWPESRIGLDLPLERSKPLASATGKTLSPVTGGDPAPRVPLRAILFLDRTAEAVEPRLERLDVAAAMTLTVPQIIRFNPHGESGQERIDAALGLTQVLRVCTAWRLVYPSDYSALPKVEALLRPLIAGTADDCAARQG